MSNYVPLKGRERTVAVLRSKLAIAVARSQWGTRAQRSRETVAAEGYRAKLRALGEQV